MKFSKRTFSFDRSEIFIMFLLLLFSGMLVFSIGIMVGKKLLENECRLILEDNLNKLKECQSNVEVKTAAEEVTGKEEAKPEEPETLKPIQRPKPKPEIEKAEDTPKQPVVSDEVEVTPEQEKQHLAIREISDEIRNKYTVQVSAHRDEKEASRITYDLYKLGFKSAYYMESQIPNKGTWYRVGIGFFSKYDSAVKFAEMLKQNDKITSYIIRKIE
ncbi:MAG: SPOR domain-containing protein [Oligoflexia bacterium]|nr:SPOR domain-containing protein [Oligoflexia bacterium]